jgi:NAD-dependent DNA ligase
MILEQASKAYYEGAPILTDEEFDAISDNYDVIGYAVEGEKHSHKYPMWSLQKAYNNENPLASYTGDLVTTVKLDGAAVSLEFVDGELTVAATRGNGKEGLVITDKMRCLIPEVSSGTFQVVGEVVAPKQIKNSRNYAAGALNLKSTDEFLQRELYFIAYGLNPTTASYTESLEFLESLGFTTVLCEDLDIFPSDGLVIRINDQNDFESMGYTAKHPRGAYALKEQTSGSITTLLDVEWNVGRSGVVAPTAILEPVLVGDALVSRATLHNIAYISALNLEIGCKVEVIRSGEIIPRIVRRV